MYPQLSVDVLKMFMDRFIDGLNRLGRPGLLAGMFVWFGWAVCDPGGYTLVMTALETTPPWVGQIGLTIVGGFVGGRVVRDIRNRYR